MWQDKTVYKGEWVKNTIQGWGIYTFEDGRVYSGQWAKNRMHGYGECFYKDGKKYFGFHNMDKKDGFGVFYWPNNKYYIGFWRGGRQNGMGKFIKGKYIRYGIWREGKKQKWFKDQDDFFNSLDPYDEKYYIFFQWDNNKINEFFEIEEKI